MKRFPEDFDPIEDNLEQYEIMLNDGKRTTIEAILSGKADLGGSAKTLQNIDDEKTDKGGYTGTAQDLSDLANSAINNVSGKSDISYVDFQLETISTISIIDKKPYDITLKNTYFNQEWLTNTMLYGTLTEIRFMGLIGNVYRFYKVDIKTNDNGKFKKDLIVEYTPTETGLQTISVNVTFEGHYISCQGVSYTNFTNTNDYLFWGYAQMNYTDNPIFNNGTFDFEITYTKKRNAINRIKSALSEVKEIPNIRNLFDEKNILIGKYPSNTFNTYIENSLYNATPPIPINAGYRYYIKGGGAAGSGFHVFHDEKGNFIFRTQNNEYVDIDVNSPVRYATLMLNRSGDYYFGLWDIEFYRENKEKNPFNMNNLLLDVKQGNSFNLYSPNLIVYPKLIYNGGVSGFTNSLAQRMQVTRGKNYLMYLPAWCYSYKHTSSYKDVAIVGENWEVLKYITAAEFERLMNRKGTGFVIQIDETFQYNDAEYTGNIYFATNVKFSTGQSMFGKIIFIEGDELNEKYLENYLYGLYPSLYYGSLLRVAGYGDSITQSGDSPPIVTRGVGLEINRILGDGALYESYAVSGYTVANVARQIVPFAKPDISEYEIWKTKNRDAIFIQIGTNGGVGSSTRNDIPIHSFSEIPYTNEVTGELIDTFDKHAALFNIANNNFWGNLCLVIEYVLYVNPQCRIFLVTEPTTLAGTGSFIQVNTTIKEIASLYGIEVIDAINNAGITDRNKHIYYLDNLHFNDLGKERWGKYLGNFLKSRLDNNYIHQTRKSGSEEIANDFYYRL